MDLSHEYSTVLLLLVRHNHLFCVCGKSTLGCLNISSCFVCIKLMRFRDCQSNIYFPRYHNIPNTYIQMGFSTYIILEAQREMINFKDMAWNWVKRSSKGKGAFFLFVEWLFARQSSQISDCNREKGRWATSGMKFGKAL